MTALLTAAGKRNKFTDRDQQEACQFIFEELSKEGPPGKVDASDISECDPSSDTGKGIKGRYYKFDFFHKVIVVCVLFDVITTFVLMQLKATHTTHAPESKPCYS